MNDKFSKQDADVRLNPDGSVWQGGEQDSAVLRGLLDRDSLREFVQPGPWRWMLGVASEWAIIAALILVCNLYPHPLIWIVAIFVIGTRQHALGILAHEGVHYTISRKRWLNDLLANLFAAYPLSYPVQGYRTHHLAHHRYLETERDPEQTAINKYPREWTFPMPRRRFLWLLLRDMIGGSIKPGLDLSRYIWQIPGGAWRHGAAIALLHGIAIAVAWSTGFIWSYVLLWLVPLFTVALMCFRVRTVAEHSGVHPAAIRYRLPAADTMATTRTTRYGPVMKFIFGPHNMAYHIEHHMFPSVPVFRLKALHKKLMSNEVYARRARVCNGYRELLNELAPQGHAELHHGT